MSSELKPTVLIVDDELQIRRLLRLCIESNGYRVSEAVCGQDALTELAQHKFDAVVLDLGLPDMDGVSILKRLREWSHIPVIILSVRDREEDKVAALDNGADDYVTKPFATGELLARLRVALRHATPVPENSFFHSGNLEVDFAARLVRLNGKEIKLTLTEYSLLKMLVQNAGKVLTHRHILREVWGPNYEDQSHYLRVYIAHLREKLEADSTRPRRISTEPGIGYRFLEEDSSG